MRSPFDGMAMLYGAPRPQSMKSIAKEVERVKDMPATGARDPELVAVDAILAALKPLQASARRRVLEYVTARDAETADPLPEAPK